jgi:hypothetical protein
VRALGSLPCYGFGVEHVSEPFAQAGGARKRAAGSEVQLDQDDPRTEITHGPQRRPSPHEGLATPTASAVAGACC